MNIINYFIQSLNIIEHNDKSIKVRIREINDFEVEELNIGDVKKAMRNLIKYGENKLNKLSCPEEEASGPEKGLSWRRGRRILLLLLLVVVVVVVLLLLLILFRP